MRGNKVEVRNDKLIIYDEEDNKPEIKRILIKHPNDLLEKINIKDANDNFWFNLCLHLIGQKHVCYWPNQMVLSNYNRYLLDITYFSMGINLFHRIFTLIPFAERLDMFQVLFKVEDDYLHRCIEAIDIRINHEVRGEMSIIYNCSFIHGDIFINPDKCEKILNFKLKSFEKTKYHVTVIPDMTNINPDGTCHIKIFHTMSEEPTKDYMEYLRLVTDTEEEFLNKARNQGFDVSPKTLRNYRSKKYQCVFPEPMMLPDDKGVIKKRYFSQWIKYLKRIEELKKLAPQHNTNATALRTLEKKLGGNTFDDIPMKKSKN